MRNIAVVLSGGTGTRMGTEIPKQYRTVAGKPVLVHTLEQLQKCAAVDGILVAAGNPWSEQIFQWKETFMLTKLLTVVPAGKNRQLSIRNGLIAAEPFMDSDELSGVVVQDAVRPLTSAELLTRLVAELREAPAIMPVLSVTDTAYISRDGQWVDGWNFIQDVPAQAFLYHKGRDALLIKGLYHKFPLRRQYRHLPS